MLKKWGGAVGEEKGECRKKPKDGGMTPKALAPIEEKVSFCN